jgi:hypothetical protein
LFAGFDSISAVRDRVFPIRYNIDITYMLWVRGACSRIKAKGGTLAADFAGAAGE